MRIVSAAEVRELLPMAQCIEAMVGAVCSAR